MEAKKNTLSNHAGNKDGDGSWLAELSQTVLSHLRPGLAIQHSPNTFFSAVLALDIKIFIETSNVFVPQNGHF